MTGARFVQHLPRVPTDQTEILWTSCYIVATSTSGRKVAPPISNTPCREKRDGRRRRDVMMSEERNGLVDSLLQVP